MNKLLLSALSFASFLLFNKASGQLELTRSEEIPVFHDGVPLSNAWAGGFNSVQVSRMDFNYDDKEDIFLFDRIARRKMVFLNVGEEPGDILYDHHFEYNSFFPNTLKNWCFLRDFNCDGKKDIFTNNSSGTRVYENTSTGTNIEFTLRTNLANSSYNLSGTPFTAPVYTIGPDLPSFVDFEGDGDLDIITWTELSSTLYFYRSLGADIGNCDSLIFDCGNRCYGMLNESTESAAIEIGALVNCDFNVIDPYREYETTNRHTGGTLLSVDLDQNGIKDLIIGDVTEDYLTSIQMAASVDALDSAIIEHNDFPATFSNTAQAVMKLFPGAFYEDIDGDGIHDLMVSPNATSEAEDRQSLWLYKNNGVNDLPEFEFLKTSFLQETMIDMGTGTYPTVLDANGDGLLDLLVSNRSYFVDDIAFTSHFRLYTNVGTSINPALELTDDNFLDIPSHEWTVPYPAFGDLDNDGDVDMVLGEQSGFLHFFRNQAGAGAPVDFVMEESPMTDELDLGIDVGQDAAPQLVDISGDGILDLVVGEKNGNINYYVNNGSLTDWSFELVEDTMGNVVASNYLGINGYSIPFFFKNENDELELLLGTETGVINHYNEIEGNELTDFTLVNTSFLNINEGDHSAIYLTDFNSDGELDLFLGQVGGGLSFYSSDTSLVDLNELVIPEIRVYPIPAKNSLAIETGTSVNTNWSVIDISGRIVMQGSLNGSKLELNISRLTSGAYFIRLESDVYKPARFLVE
jgi:Secretion system C-terminal sorting domain/FG-GAP-like repeat